ncbi:helix-turn-helix transcriptional regulator [Paenibacillus sp. JDR-2]|uniref:helix-turn-helix transcriptional regulator n=1 Tax=Paenibacillus sp. (strain JDR-2) TaxID=324057 RepID=UPI0001668DCB|nr:WYL domain-containing protein [Paenibacillus sp. JDR-2]ACT03362.1 transcriptional regulator protein-like protein [Paenibacillus sp. JDR-2]
MTDHSNIRRVMLIRDILLEHSDENHVLSITDIINHLRRYYGSEYKVSRNTVRSAIQELQNGGFNIEELIKDNTVYYSHIHRKFEIHELRMLIDAVSSAKFITPAETNRLIEKIKALTSRHQARKLHHQITVDPTVKAKNEEVKYHIDKIHTAINEQKMLHFKYGNYNTNKDFVFRREGAFYTVIPLGLVWNSDYYYLVAKKDPADVHVKHYRVDRMKNVSISDDRFNETEFNISTHLKQTFNMYPGDVESVEIQFHNHLINVVIDRFGRDIIIHEVDNDTFSITIRAALSEGLLRWLLMWGSDAKVISPQSLIDKMRSESKKMFEKYS